MCIRDSLYLAPQFFANKPVERLLGEGIRAEDLNDDCLGRTLDWIYEQDPTRLLAGIARPAHEVFGVGRERIHVDTTSFSVSGEYSSRSEAADGAVIEVTWVLPRPSARPQAVDALPCHHRRRAALYARP